MRLSARAMEEENERISKRTASKDSQIDITTHQAHPTSTTKPKTTHPPAFAAQSPAPAAPPAAEPASKPLVFHSGAHSSMEESSASISNAWEMTRTTRQPRGRAANPSRRETRGDWSTKGCCVVRG